MTKKKKSNSKKIKRISFLLIILFIIISSISFGIFKLVETINYHNSYEYKLIQVGYNKDESKKLVKIFNEDKLKNFILEGSKNNNLLKLINEKYFLVKHIDRYLAFYQDNRQSPSSYIVSMVNVNRDRDLYVDPIKTDLTKDFAMLVNKYHYLGEDYLPKELYPVSNWYSYGENSLIEEVYDAYIKLFNDAKKENLFIVINSSYRDYKEQKTLYDLEINSTSIEYADSYIARPGFSEHQSGMAIDVSDGACIFEECDSTPEIKWMMENAHKYGFILRYPKDKENLTGYGPESWHYRYLGVDLATKVYHEGITYDEYYAYYLDK